MAESVLQEGDEDLIAEIDYRLALCFYTFFVVFLGIVIQEVSGGALRTTSLTIAIGMCFLLNRFNNFTQKVSDLKISRDNVVMRTDIMTGMQNRYAYDEKLGEMVTL